MEVRELGPEQCREIEGPEDSCIHILRGLISYHERMTMGNYPERDMYLDALRVALECVQERRDKKTAQSSGINLL